LSVVVDMGGELCRLVACFKLRTKGIQVHQFLDRFVVVRTYSAGVHMGVLSEWNGTHVVLTDARRLWSWTGAFTLNEVSQNGCGEDSRISNPVPIIGLTQAIEVIPASEQAISNLSRTRNA